jgi:hypothetical protein
MINNRNKHNQKCGRFRSYTDINNYNNFLLELDKKQKEEPQISINITSNNTSSSKNEIKKIVKNINKDFTASNYDNQNFTGLSPWESLLAAVEKHMDPNIYQSDEKMIVKEKEPVTLKPVYTKKVNIVSEINNINDLLQIIETYPNDKHTEYNINIDALHKIKKPLNELQNMIGMKDLKENIVDQIIFYI